MAEEAMPRPAATAGLAAALLDLGRPLDRWSLTLVAIALLGLLLCREDASPVARLGLLASVAAGGAQKVWALRVALDRALFAQWARRWQRPAATPESDMAELDRALAAAGLRAAPASPARDLAQRVRGARRLLAWQGAALALQAALLAGAAWAGGPGPWAP